MVMATLNRYTVLAAAVALACSAWAQQPPDQYQPDQNSAGQYQDSSDQVAQNEVDPPTRVARLGYMTGEVSFAPAGENDWVSAQRNRPLTTGDKLYTNDGRAELQIGTSSILLDARSNMDFLTLNDQLTQVELTQGSLDVNVRRLSSGEVYEVDTPTIAFVADQVGDYRIDVDADGKTMTVSVRQGSGDAIGEGGTRVRVNSGEAIVFNDPQLTDYRTVALRSGDSFDSYTRERIVRYEHAPARRYVSEEVVGSADLDEYGSWDEAPEYGHVWYPNNVSSDWAPYHDGNWVWQDPWGRSWVDNSEWGFAPFHYGRWAYVGSRWGWIPGPADVRPVYAPALVAFVGGGGFGVDISVGGPIGWFPLGPRDVYVPSYRVGRDYFRRVNVSNTVVNTTVINNFYGQYRTGNVNYAQMNFANRRVPRAVTAVPTNAFVSGRPVAASAIAVNPNQLANARIMARATVAPTAASLVASRGRATPPPAAIMNRPVIAATRPAPAPVPFAQRQALLKRNPGQPLTTAQLHTVAAARPNANAPAAVTRSNVRVAAGANAPGNRGMAQQPRGNAPNAPGMAQQQRGNAPNAPGATRMEQQRAQQMQAQQGRARGQLPSSRYTQQQRGAPPRESVTAQQNASANARFNRGNAPPNAPTPRESATAQQNAAANARFNRGNAPPNAATTAQSRAAEARAQQQQRAQAQQAQAQTRIGQQRMNAQQRAQQQQQGANTQRMEAQNRAAEARGNAQARSQQQSRAEEQRMSAQQQRAQQQQQAASSQRMEAQNRAADARANAQAQQRAQAQARGQQEQQQRAQAQARAQQEQRAQAQAQRAPMREQRAPAPTREQQAPQQRAQAQYREPPRPTQQAPQQRQQPQQAPQQRQQAKRKNDKDQQPPGGG